MAMPSGNDAIQMLVNLSGNLNSVFVKLGFTLGTLFAVVGAVTYLVHHASTSRKAPGQSQGSGKVIAWILLCGGLAGLDQMIQAGARQLGWQGATFDAISYVDVGTFGVAADAANAVLTLVRMLGVFFALQGMLTWRRSLKDGHTGLSASQDVSTGTLKFVLGVFCVCNPYLLDALQKSLGMQ
ncbi:MULTISPECIES: conjugal transfer protein TraQ [unclassified Pseudomonas]|uniref:conjugal transfer protein TraQ n=1 Tax=unclassified Pseudomonas TaxID=196821 RepID=UPI002AB38893|nr:MULTISPECIES: conjugal transfer protein TraQ [unclassified Pseudomonas]MDY7563410.1 conjugal transfer protein TraQ [Pseudomonas sp. AB6]MEA9979848.1 conjugal transfer protein TraQ [Pseudomonas sp. RTS4]MEA9996480.1 conjugal transfer protein TraQ [Pseudomonas sp. AA4]MEB0198150.1 conjugal transfer protein TraQ [Pseudomonas sp. 5S4]MEB0213361.1 conjugal transfer protein TraQ [Pseudomonas sp. AB6]